MMRSSQTHAPTREQPTRTGASGSTASERALAEAEARRALQKEATRPLEIDGAPGPDPVRFGDWETKGLARDF